NRLITLFVDDGTHVAQSAVAVTNPPRPPPDLTRPAPASDAPATVPAGEFTIMLRDGWRITGRAPLGHHSTPHARARVTLHNLQSRSFQTRTDAAGRFALPGIPEPGFWLMVEPSADGAFLGRNFEVDFPPEKRQIDLAVIQQKGIAVTGIVVDADSGEG